MIEATGRGLIGACTGAGRATLLALAAAARLPQIGRTLPQVLRQLDRGGFGSLVVLSLIAGLTGMIMVMQLGPTLERYQALETIGGIIATTFCRELGPIWAAVIILARVGSSMAAELGTMTVNEEVEALKVMGVDHIRYLVMPRILALVLAMPVLTAVADAVGLLGAGLVANSLFAVSSETFLESVRSFLSLGDFVGGLIKGCCFGVIIGAIACDRGLHTEGGAEGVGRSTTDTVRLCVVFVLVADLVLTALLSPLSEWL